MSQLSFAARRISQMVFGVAAWAAFTGAGGAVVGQTPPPPRVLTPPVPVDPYSTGPSGPVGPNAPLSIAPVPDTTFYPPPGFPFDSGPRVVGPRGTVTSPAYVVPFPYGPALPVPGYPAPPVFPQQPVPIQPTPYPTNFAPSEFSPQGVPVEVRRPAGPSNLQVTVSEAFLNRLVTQERVEPGPVRDVILGAQVSGQQTTVAKVRADLVASQDNARVILILNGDVQSLTTGVTPQAMIETLGKQQFYALKEVYFDGVQLSTRHAEVYIRALNQTLGAMTPLSGTLFGGFADRIAFRAAERQKAAGEAAARDRLADRLFPSFDGEVDAKLATANRQLGPIRKRLDAVKLLPSTQSAWSTDTSLTYEAYVGDNPASVLPPATQTTGETGIRLTIHESLINTFIDRTGLKGLKTTDKELRDLEDRFLSKALGSSSVNEPTIDDGTSSVLKAPVLPTETPGFVTDIEFDQNEPLKVRVEQGRLLVIIKAHFKPAGQSLVPPMVVTIPYEATVVGDKVRLTGGSPVVVAQDRPDPTAPPTLLEKAIQKVIEAELDPLEFNRTLPPDLWRVGGPPPRIAAIKSDDNGWISIAIE